MLLNGYTVKSIMQVLEILQADLQAQGKFRFKYLREYPDDKIMMTCPFHKGGQEVKPSANIVLVEKSGLSAGFFHCYVCGDWRATLDFFSFISAVLGRRDGGQEGIKWCKEKGLIECRGTLGLFKNLMKPSMIDVESLLKKSIQTGKSPYIYFNHELKRVVYTDLYRQEKIDGYEKREYYTEEELQYFRYTHDYVYKRGVTDDLIEKFDIGYDRKNECITFPCKDENGCYAIIRRNVKFKRYELPSEEKPIWGLYEVPNNAESVIICESIFNALSLWKWGYYAIALLGLGTERQVKMINWRGWKSVYLAFDGDLAGRKATEKWCKALRWFSVGVYDVPDGKDVNDLSQEEFEALPIYQYPYGISFGDRKYRNYKNAFKERAWN